MENTEPRKVDHETPHNLYKQIIGLTISSLIFLFFGGPFLVLTGICTFIDCWKSGIYKIKGKKSLLNLSPMAWGIAMQGLLILTLPLYLVNRNKLKTINNSNLFFYLAIAFGIGSLTFAFFFQIPKNEIL